MSAETNRAAGRPSGQAIQLKLSVRGGYSRGSPTPVGGRAAG